MLHLFKRVTLDFFDIASSQRRAFIYFLILIVLYICARWYINQIKPPVKKTTITSFEILPLEKKSKPFRDQYYHKNKNKKFDLSEMKSNFQPFVFNPNTATVEDYKKMNLNDGQIKTIFKLKKKFGGFKRKKDFLSLSFLEDDWKKSIENYILLPSDYEKKTYIPISIPLIDINTTDSIALEKLPGIGSYTASKIIKWRNKLGGFVYKEQLKELQLLYPEQFNQAAPYIQINTPAKKINLNHISYQELSKHPWVGWRNAKNICNYYRQHGKFVESKTLKEAKLIPDSVYQKILPYISF